MLLGGEKFVSKIQLVLTGKLVKIQLAQSQNLLSADERTIVKIFTAETLQGTI